VCFFVPCATFGAPRGGAARLRTMTRAFALSAAPCDAARRCRRRQQVLPGLSSTDRCTQPHGRGRRRLSVHAAVDAPGKPGYSRKTVAMPRRRGKGPGQGPAQTQRCVVPGRASAPTPPLHTPTHTLHRLTQRPQREAGGQRGCGGGAVPGSQGAESRGCSGPGGHAGGVHQALRHRRLRSSCRVRVAAGKLDALWSAQWWLLAVMHAVCAVTWRFPPLPLTPP
jgi:hypothetical protein